MRKPAKPKRPWKANPFIGYGFDSAVDVICHLARKGLPWDPDPDEIAPPRRRRQGGQIKQKPKSRLRTFADDPRLTEDARNEILGNADRLEKARATFNEIVAELPAALADNLLGCAHDIVEASYASGQLDPNRILRRLGTKEANARRDKTASKRTDEIIVEAAKPFMARRSKWTWHSIAVEIRPAVNKRLKADGLRADDKPLSVVTIRRRLAAQTP